MRDLSHDCRASSVAERPLPADGGGSIPTARLLKGEWEVRKLALENVQRIVRDHHYARGGSNTAVLTTGLFRREQWFGAFCYAVTWWLPPTMTAAQFIEPSNPGGVLSLSRVAAVPTAPKNSCSFLIRHSMRFIDRDRWPVLVTYADQWRGHVGTIYKALADLGWKEDGYTKPERTYVRAGRMVSRKRGPTTMTHSEMLADGCECVGAFRRKRFVHRVES